MKFEIDDLDDARKAIKQAWIAGLISGGLTLLLAVFAIVGDGSVLGGLVDGWAMIDAFITFGLTYGVYRRNRAASVGLLSFYLLNQILMRLDGISTGGIGLALVFTLMFVQGVRGTFAYHRFTTQESAEEAA